MIPTFCEDDIIVALNSYLSIVQRGDIVIAQDPRDGRLLVKRVREIKHGSYFLTGDNETESTDSRVFGWVKQKDIVGKVLLRI